jgi:hypothetical protein
MLCFVALPNKWRDLVLKLINMIQVVELTKQLAGICGVELVGNNKVSLKAHNCTTLELAWQENQLEDM